jgi:Tfp pilus assembly protein PilF
VNVEYPDFDAQFQKAVLDLAANRVADAQTSIVGALRLRPESAEAHYVMAAAYLRRAQVMSSIDELDQTLRRDPHFLPARIELARYRVAANAPEVALELLANTPEGGDLPALAVERGWALLQWGDRDRLRTHFEVRRNNRGNAQQIAYALWLLETGNPAAASRIAEELLRSNPSDMRGLLVLARCRLVTAGPDAALETIRSYAARERTPAVLHFWGELLSIAHRPPEAVEALRAATASGSVTPVLAVSVARAELRAGQVASAEGRLKGLAAADPLDYQARFLLGVAQQMRGEYAAAAESYGKVLDSIPSHVPSLYNLAYLLAEHLGKPEQALHIAEKARELAPESPAVDDVFGWVLYRRGLKPLAAIHLSAAAAAGSVRARYHLAMVRLESGDAPGARQALAEALKRDPDLPEAAAVQRALNPPGGAASAAPAMPDALAIGWEDLGESNNVAARIEAYQRTRGCEPGPATLSALWNERNPRRFTMAVVLPLTLCEPRPTLTPTPLAANIPEDPSSNWANPDLMLQTLFDLSGVNAANAAGWDNTFVSWDTDRKGIPAKVKPSLYQTRDGTLRPPLHPDEAGWNVYDSIWPRTFR